MNPRITDLLDDYVDTSVRLFSPDEVLRGTDSGTKKSPAPQSPRHRMKKPMAIAAALLLILSGIAVAGLKLSSVGPSGASLTAGQSEDPPPAQSSVDSRTQSNQEMPETAEDASTDDELDLSPADDLHSTQPVEEDDGKSSVLTSSTGLILNARNDCENAGEIYVDDTISLKNSADGTIWDLHVVFAAFDKRNRDADSGGFLWAVVAGTPDQLPMELPEGYQCDIMGHLDGNAYSIVMPTSGDPQYSETSYSCVMSYFEHANAINWTLNQVITALTTSTEEQVWIEDYQAQVLDPVTSRYAQLEQARQDSLQPTDESLSLPAAENHDGLLTAELNLSVETEYGTAVIQTFTLDSASGQFCWYTDLSGLSAPFTEYTGDNDDVLENEEYQAAWLVISNAIQKALADSLLVYPDGSHLCLSTGELWAYENHVYRCYDTIGLAATEPASSGNPSCVEISGVTYRFT